jgi:hypothetical protein
MIGELTVAPDFPFARAVLATLIAAVGSIGYFWKKE